MSKTTISIKGVGSVNANHALGTLAPTTPVAGMRLGVGYTPLTTAHLERQRARRQLIEELATAKLGLPEWGWSWQA